ncbi:hypothetical protein BGZ76_006421, partial [Entomortierella beljakovae]
NFKDAIKEKKKNTLSGLDPNQLVLYLIPNGGATKKGLEKLPKDSLKPLDEELDPLYTHFPAAVASEGSLRKRGRDEDEAASDTTKKVKINSSKLVTAIKEAGLAGKALSIEDRPNLSKLNTREKIRVLDFLSEKASMNQPSSKCYVYTGSTVYTGNIEDFQEFLLLGETWYLVDSSENPILDQRAKTVISASLMTIVEQYKEVDKEAPDYYHMAPWELEELEKCRVCVDSFNMVQNELMEELYCKLGGVP